MIAIRTRWLATVGATCVGVMALSLTPAVAQGPAPARTVPVTSYSTGTPGLAARVAHAKRVSTSTVSGGAVPASVSAAVSSKLLQNFNGVSSRDSEVTNFNLRFEPPDQGLCAGNGFVLEPVNSAYRIYKTSGKTLRGPFNVNDLFNEGAKEFTSDPRCWYDAPTHTWFATILFINSTNNEGRIDIAVNPNPDPTGLWTEYQIDTTSDGRQGEPNDPGCPCFGDQPRIGIDQTNLYVTTDEFSILGPQSNGGQIYAIAKSDLIAGAAQIHFVHFGNLKLGGAVSGAPQPALSIGNPSAEYFLSQLDPAGNGDNRIGVWAMTKRGAVATGGSPILSSTVISSEPYAIPPPAKQRGSSSTLDSGDDRMQQVEFVNGSVWGELDTAIKPAGDSSTRAGAAWFQVRPWLNGQRIGGATIRRQGYVATRGNYVIYPAIQPDAAGNAAMVFTLTGSGRFASAAYTLLRAGATNFGAPVVAAAGTGPYDKKSTRWGDYSFAVPAWSSDSAWLATEYVPPLSSQTSTRQSNWGTRVLEVKLG